MDSLLRHRKWWSEEEDRILCNEANQYMNRKDLWDWNSIASKLEGRTNKDCRKRWLKISQGVNKGAWTKAEDARLKKAVEKFGCRWTDVAKFVETRHADQCSKRWQHSLDPSLSHLPWTTEEYKTLHSAVQQHGRKWKYISDHIMIGRSSTDLKNRYVIIERLQSQGAALPWVSDQCPQFENTPPPDELEQPYSREGSSVPVGTPAPFLHQSIEGSSALPTPHSLNNDRLNVDPFSRISMSPAAMHSYDRDDSVPPYDIDSDVDMSNPYMSGYVTPLDNGMPSYPHSDITTMDPRLFNHVFAMDKFRMQNMTPCSELSSMDFNHREITSAPRFSLDENTSAPQEPMPELQGQELTLDQLEQDPSSQGANRRVILDGVESETLTAIVELLFQKRSKLNMRIEENAV